VVQPTWKEPSKSWDPMMHRTVMNRKGVPPEGDTPDKHLRDGSWSQFTSKILCTRNLRGNQLLGLPRNCPGLAPEGYYHPRRAWQGRRWRLQC